MSVKWRNVEKNQDMEIKSLKYGLNINSFKCFMFLSEQWSILNYLFQKNLNCQQKYKIETVTFFSFVVIRV